MKLETGKVISLKQTYVPIAGCTLSYQICSMNKNNVSIFSLGKNTNISAEQYQSQKMIHVIQGSLMMSDDIPMILEEQQMVMTQVDHLVGINAREDTIYLEIDMEEMNMVNEVCKAGDVKVLKELVLYKENSVVNMDLLQNDQMKYAVMSFDSGTSLSEHAAPCDAIVFGLEGEAVITYEGVDYTIHENEIFRFEKFGRHAVKAEKKFKMALLLVKE